MVKTLTFDSNEAWLIARRAGIGGSDAATLFDKNQWKTEADLMKDKLDPNPPEYSQSGPAKMGHIMEPYIFQNYVLPANPTAVAYDDVIMSNDKYARLLASPDALTEELVIEIKFVLMMGSGKWKSPEGKWEVPETYWMQVQHYMAVTERKNAIIYAYFEEDGEVRTFNIKQDESFIYQLNIKSIDFFDKLDKHTDEILFNVPTEEKPILVEDLKEIKAISKKEKELKLRKAALSSKILAMYDDSVKMEFGTLKGSIQKRKTKNGYSRSLKVS